MTKQRRHVRTSKKGRKFLAGKRKITKKLVNEIKQKLEAFEEWNNGLRLMNGGFTIVKIHEIQSSPGFYHIFADSTIGIQAGGEGDYETKYPNTEYYVSKKDLHVMTDAEIDKAKGMRQNKCEICGETLEYTLDEEKYCPKCGYIEAKK
jgi:hypothetical protein